ncbi:hypothetical protein [Streptomyces sp. NPDC001083]|uniref:hypothetical protein n=1 Tax=Streptomyces sp. NPDC001083 TaxID=3364545 RepID=UPI00369C3DC5
MAVTRPAPRPVPAALPPAPPSAHSPGSGGGNRRADTRTSPSTSTNPSASAGAGGGRGSRGGGGAVVPGAGRALAHRYAALPPPLEVALAALRLEALLGDPRDAANPYGLPALTTRTAPTPRITGREADGGGADSGGAGGGGGEERAGLLAAAGLGRIPAADQLVRALRPVLRRDVALGHACAAAAGPCPVPAALRGPVALLAVTATLLRQAARIVDGRCGSEPALRQWRPVLAAAFADLLACESLTGVALRRPAARPVPGGLLPAVAGYVVPTVVADVLARLELVLTECGHGPAGLEGRMLAKLARDLPAAGVDAAGVTAWQTHLVRALPTLARSPRPPYLPHPAAPPALPVLFRLADPHPAPAPAPAPAPGTGPGPDRQDLKSQNGQNGQTPDGPDGYDGQGPDGPDGHDGPDGEGDGVVLAGLVRGAARPVDGAGDTVRAALAAVARRLLSEHRALRRVCRTAGRDGSEDPAVRALADRQALLWLAAAVLGVQEAADDGRGLFLGGPHWTLLALSGITERLGVPLPGPAADPREQVWAELADRVRHGVDCDIYATRLLW